MTGENPARVELRAVPDAGGDSLWTRKAVFLEGEAEAIGHCGLSPLENPGPDISGTGRSVPAAGKKAEIVFGLDPAYRGRGYASRAVRQCLDQAFAAGLDAVFAGIEGGNGKAIALVIRLGFGIEGERRNPKTGRNEILFSLEKKKK